MIMVVLCFFSGIGLSILALICGAIAAGNAVDLSRITAWKSTKKEIARVFAFYTTVSIICAVAAGFFWVQAAQLFKLMR